jgi:hypothetical protein
MFTKFLLGNIEKSQAWLAFTDLQADTLNPSFFADTDGAIYTSFYRLGIGYLVKLKFNGVVEWARSINPVNSNGSCLLSVTGDNGGNIYACGGNITGSGSKGFLIKISSVDGSTIWAREFDKGNGNPCVFGSVFIKSNGDIAVLEGSAAGFTSSSVENAYVVYNANGSVSQTEYITRFTTSSTNIRGVQAKNVNGTPLALAATGYNSNNAAYLYPLEATSPFPSGNSFPFIYQNALCIPRGFDFVPAASNASPQICYLIGLDVAFPSTGQTFIAKVSPNAANTGTNLYWLKRFDAIPGTSFFYGDLAVDDNGNAYCAGVFDNTAILLIKIDTNGNVVWKNTIDILSGGPPVIQIRSSTRISLGVSGDYLIVSFSSDYQFVLKVPTNGSLRGTYTNLAGYTLEYGNATLESRVNLSSDTTNVYTSSSFTSNLQFSTQSSVSAAGSPITNNTPRRGTIE